MPEGKETVNVAKASQTTTAPKTTTPAPSSTPAPAPTVKTTTQAPVASAPKVTDYGKLKALNIVNALKDTGSLPNKADCQTLLDMKADDKTPVYYAQVLVKGLLGGDAVPSAKQLNKLLDLLT